MTACVYAICFPNGKLYVGITAKTVEHRFREHCQGSRQCVGRAICKYGAENVWLVTLTRGVSWAEAKELEIYWIDRLGTQNRQNGYNMTAGGDGAVGFRHSDKARERIGQSSRERPRTLEHCQRIAAAKRGKPRLDLQGRSLSAEHRQKISAANRGRRLSSEHRRSLSEAMKGNVNATRK